jgi:hypothetical protein
MAEAKPETTKTQAPKAPAPAQHQPAHEQQHEREHESDHHLARDQLNPAARAHEPREQLPATTEGGDRTVERSGADRTGAAKDRLSAEKALRAQQAARPVGRPTPTAEECDLIAMGLPISKVGHADDGSGPDPYRTRDMSAGRRPAEKGYETR